MAQGQWEMRVEGGLSAHFKQADAPSRPGTLWTIALKRGNEICRATVKGLLADDATPKTRSNEQYQAQTAMQYLNDLLNAGWHPAQLREHTIYIGNPSLPSAVTATRPWWRFW